jgi:hypothetical protein
MKNRDVLYFCRPQKAAAAGASSSISVGMFHLPGVHLSGPFHTGGCCCWGDEVVPAHHSFPQRWTQHIPSLQHCLPLDMLHSKQFECVPINILHSHATYIRRLLGHITCSAPHQAAHHCGLPPLITHHSCQVHIAISPWTARLQHVMEAWA